MEFDEDEELCDCGKMCKDHTDEEAGECLNNILTSGLGIEEEVKKAWVQTH